MVGPFIWRRSAVRCNERVTKYWRIWQKLKDLLTNKSRIAIDVHQEWIWGVLSNLSLKLAKARPVNQVVLAVGKRLQTLNCGKKALDGLSAFNVNLRKVFNLLKEGKHHQMVKICENYDLDGDAVVPDDHTLLPQLLPYARCQLCKYLYQGRHQRY